MACRRRAAPSILPRMGWLDSPDQDWCTNPPVRAAWVGTGVNAQLNSIQVQGCPNDTRLAARALRSVSTCLLGPAAIMGTARASGAGHGRPAACVLLLPDVANVFGSSSEPAGLAGSATGSCLDGGEDPIRGEPWNSMASGFTCSCIQQCASCDGTTADVQWRVTLFVKAAHGLRGQKTPHVQTPCKVGVCPAKLLSRISACTYRLKSATSVKQR